jgi:F-type H+-transporting ATPase subunit epsilon
MKLTILSPDSTLYQGAAECVMLPGLQGAFTILDRHAPVFSGLGGGAIRYRCSGKEFALDIAGGFVEARKNIVTICVE